MPTDTVAFTIDLFGKPYLVTWWIIFGLAGGNALFSGRVLLQWWASERAGRTVVPVSFWWISVVATAVHFIYACHIREIPFMIMLSVTLVPYVRNLSIHYRPNRPPLPMIPMLIVSIILTLIPTFFFGYKNRDHLDGWIVLGLIGTFIYSSRFFVSWIESERNRQATLSLKFWWISLIGSLLMLAYALIRHNLVFILAFLFNGIPFVRNIVLTNRQNKAAAPTAPAGVGG